MTWESFKQNKQSTKILRANSILGERFKHQALRQTTVVESREQLLRSLSEYSPGQQLTMQRAYLEMIRPGTTHMLVVWSPRNVKVGWSLCRLFCRSSRNGCAFHRGNRASATHASHALYLNPLNYSKRQERWTKWH